MDSPTVSVVMSVKNGERYVRDTMESILQQEFRDFEAIVLDNGSNDGTIGILEGIQDPRIRLVKNGTDLGMACSWNKGFALARGKYLARMDADDIASPNRLARQVEFMESNRRCGVVGSWAAVIDETGRPTGELWKYPFDFGDVKCSLALTNCLIHPSVMIRAACGPEYRSRYTPAEDYELWLRLAREWDIANVPDVLLYYRLHAGSTSIDKKQQMENSVRTIYKEFFQQLLPDASEEESNLHYQATIGGPGISWRQLLGVERWLARLYAALPKYFRVSDVTAFRILTERYFNIAALNGLRFLGAAFWLFFFPASLWAKFSFIAGRGERERRMGAI